MIRTTGRLLAAHWPALLAWFLAGELGRYLCISSAAYVAQVSEFAGSLLVGLGVLAKLVSLVAMLLVLRDGLHTLSAIAPAPAGRKDRRRFFHRCRYDDDGAVLPLLRGLGVPPG